MKQIFQERWLQRELNEETPWLAETTALLPRVFKPLLNTHLRQ
jgi:hypothetical protein